jgi:hypothetical protein
MHWRFVVVQQREQDTPAIPARSRDTASSDIFTDMGDIDLTKTTAERLAYYEWLERQAQVPTRLR